MQHACFVIFTRVLSLFALLKLWVFGSQECGFEADQRQVHGLT